MCFYPVCIILRPAAALSAAARGRSGPAPTPASQPLPKAFLILRPAAVAAPGQKRSLLITRGRHSGAAELFSPRTPPPLPLRAVPRLFPSGDRRGEGREGGALGSLAAPLGLTSTRSESPGAPVAKLLRPGRRATIRGRPSCGAGGGAGRGPARTPPEVTPRISSHPDRAQITCLPHLKKKN